MAAGVGDETFAPVYAERAAESPRKPALVMG